MRTLKFRVYLDSASGNEFVFFARGHVVDERKSDWTLSDVILNTMLWTSIMGVKVAPRQWLEAEVDSNGDIFLEHVVGTMYSRNLKHGGCNVWFVGGPLFDKQKALREGL